MKALGFWAIVVLIFLGPVITGVPGAAEKLGAVGFFVLMIFGPLAFGWWADG